MTHFPPLLADAPAGRHICQFHRESKSLTAAVAGYVDIGLYRREGVLVAAPAERRAAVLRRLGESGIDVAAAIASGQLVMLDAHATLVRFMRDGIPVPELFREVMVPLLTGLYERGRSRVRVFGEMVNVLWHGGHEEAAVRLEELWNELALEQSFSLFCGYEIDSLEAHAYAAPLDAVARSHTDVIASEDDERLQDAVDAATMEILGLPLSRALTYFGREGGAERRLPPGQRTLLWLNRNMPSAMIKVLARSKARYSPV